MNPMELKHLAEKVKTGIKICMDDEAFCLNCPYKGDTRCGDKLLTDAATVIEGLQTRLYEVVKTNEKNVDNFLTAKMELEYHMDRADALEKENGELKENNVRLAEQNKKLLGKEIENTRLCNENKELRVTNQDLDERNNKLVDEIRTRDKSIRNLLEELDRQNKELFHHREWARLVRSQPMILHTEPVKIEPVSCDFAKMAKAANKAAIACERFNKALDELSIVATKF